VKIAVVGSGVSGLVCAHLLAPRHDVVLYEADGRVGGHVHTIDVPGSGGRSTAVDTGFIVFNARTYPSFIKLLQRLGVASQESDMSLSVRGDRRDLEYACQDLDTLYAQRRNLLSPRFHRMVFDLLRFYRQARELLEAGPEIELATWLDRHHYSQAFVEDHLLPSIGAIWSSNREGVRQFPARFLARFLENHGFLQVSGRPPWLTVRGGSRSYVEAILAGFGGELRRGCPVASVRRQPGGVLVAPRAGAPERFDHVILACHADQALQLLADASDEERAMLAAFPYRANEVLLHQDEAVMPRRRRAWSSWNYHLDDEERSGACVTYWMNRLQRLPPERDFFVTLNRGQAVRPERVLRRLEYHHPVFTVAGVEAQVRRQAWIDRGGVSCCGAYWRNGFHEDGVVSALDVCQRFEVGL
jgi:predicted NAD/FAD-binding protein